MNEGTTTFMGILLIILALVIYFLPWMAAVGNKHPNQSAIGVLNLFLGWLVLPWVIALVWAFTNPTQVVIAPQPDAPAADSVKCPFCAEAIRPDAIKCKHCGSAVQPRPADGEDQPEVEAMAVRAASMTAPGMHSHR